MDIGLGKKLLLVEGPEEVLEGPDDSCLLVRSRTFVLKIRVS